ncbi:hypothetical protein QM201_04280 [Enterobacter asburiae]|nr:hypothetical protein [Enterobacter asburiae]
MQDVLKSIDEAIKKSHLDQSSLNQINKLFFLRKLAIYLMTRDMSLEIDSVIQIENESTGYSEYRILNDCETDNRDLWVEYKNGSVRLNSGDLMIKMK